MKNYDYPKAKAVILTAQNLESASLGMGEDWWWTAETIWEGGEWKHPIFQSETLDPEAVIAGIRGSNWATPTLHLVFKDGRQVKAPCYVGQSEGENPFPGLGLGCLSAPSQDHFNQIPTDPTITA